MWFSALWQAFRSISLPDILDMAVVAGFIYSLLLWFEWTKAAFVARGMLILAALYVLARQMGMVLTTWLFHGFFTIFVIAVVVIFQEEIRRFFERLALWTWGRKAAPLQNELIETLVRCLGVFAHERIGALIVIKGKDPLDRHLDGGFELDGKPSTALLQSIFDVHSDGHDGAVIIEEGLLRRFAVHLPLSKNLESLAGWGTRHAAATGLSEVTDALCLVVSEQKGTISIAQNGRLFPSADLGELATLLERFIARENRSRSTSWTDYFFRNKAEKALAVGLSLLLWLVFVQGFKPDVQSFVVPVSVQNLPEGMRYTTAPRKVGITLSGLKRDLDLVSPGRIHLSLNLEGRSLGTERIMITDDNVRAPESLHFASAEPPAIELMLSKPHEVASVSISTPDATQNPAPLSSSPTVPRP